MERTPDLDPRSIVKLALRNGVAVITGAASGIGRATTIALAGRGCHLALVDRSGEGLAETAREAAARGVRVNTHVLDVTDEDAVAACPGRCWPSTAV